MQEEISTSAVGENFFIHEKKNPWSNSWKFHLFDQYKFVIGRKKKIATIFLLLFSRVIYSMNHRRNSLSVYIIFHDNVDSNVTYIKQREVSLICCGRYGIRDLWNG